MVVTTQVCGFTEYKIYPGRGIKFITRDCKAYYFVNRKSFNFFKNETKAIKLNWTLAWRKHFNKGRAETRSKRKARKQARIQRDIEGLSLDKITEYKKPEIQSKLREDAIKEMKERKKKLLEQKKASSKVKGPGGKKDQKPISGKQPKK